PLDKPPHRPHRMIARHQIVDHHNLPARLMPLRLPQPWRPPTRRLRHSLLRQIPKQFAIVRHRPVPPHTSHPRNPIAPPKLAATLRLTKMRETFTSSEERPTFLTLGVRGAAPRALGYSRVRAGNDARRLSGPWTKAILAIL